MFRCFYCIFVIKKWYTVLRWLVTDAAHNFCRNLESRRPDGNFCDSSRWTFICDWTGIKQNIRVLSEVQWKSLTWLTKPQLFCLWMAILECSRKHRFYGYLNWSNNKLSRIESRRVRSEQCDVYDEIVCWSAFLSEIMAWLESWLSLWKALCLFDDVRRQL